MWFFLFHATLDSTSKYKPHRTTDSTDSSAVWWCLLPNICPLALAMGLGASQSFHDLLWRLRIIIYYYILLYSCFLCITMLNCDSFDSWPAVATDAGGRFTRYQSSCAWTIQIYCRILKARHWTLSFGARTHQFQMNSHFSSIGKCLHLLVRFCQTGKLRNHQPKLFKSQRHLQKSNFHFKTLV